MPHSIRPRRPIPSRASLLTRAAFLSVAAALAGCGGSSSSPGVAHLSSGKSVSTGSTESGGSPESPAGLEQAAVAYAKCMRASGVPNFPDPSPGGGFLFHARTGIDPRSPAVKAAQSKCRHLMPAGPGSGPPPSAQTLARFLNIARCMRQHGVYDFPDPRTSVPPNPFGSGGAGVISDIEGVILIFPSTIDQQSPTFTRASAVCAFPLHNH